MNAFSETRPLHVYLTEEAMKEISPLLGYPEVSVELTDHNRSEYAITGFHKGRYLYIPLGSVLFATQDPEG